MTQTYFAYHLTHFFGPFSRGNYHTNSEKAREGDLVYVVSGDDSDVDFGKDYSLEGVFRIYRRTVGTWKLRSLTGEPREFRYRLSMVPVNVPDKPIPLTRAGWYSRDEVHRYFSSGQNFNPLPTMPNYKERFDTLLSGFGDTTGEALAEDLAEIERKVADITERDRLTKARVGQGKYRSDVTALWGLGGVCPLTGIDIAELLVASHIKPWRESNDEERLDPANGLLLATHADKLFDKYLLSFRYDRGDFKAVLHPRVMAVAGVLGIKVGQRLNASHVGFSQTERLRAYLKQHCARFEEQVKKDAPE